MSRRPLLLTSAPNGGVTLDATQTPTAVEVNGKALQGRATLSRQELEKGVVLLLAYRVVLVLGLTEAEIPPPSFPGLLGESLGMLKVRQQIERVADSEFPILVRGESGTGKELVARAIHQTGRRKNLPYLEVNVGAIPQHLAAAELFGAVKGAYTGANRSRLGYFRRARGGILFLDEIGEASAEVQVLLLRALETGQIQPVGAEESVASEAQIIAATDTDLEAAIAAGEFRSPLLHRLSGYEIFLPALRERREDFGRLFFYFLRMELGNAEAENHLRDTGQRPWIPADLISRLALCPWPGNVRQLRNVVRQLVVTSRGQAQMETPQSVQRMLAMAEGGVAVAVGIDAVTGYRSQESVSEEELKAALLAERWAIRPTARRLNVSSSTLYRMIDAYPSIRKAGDLEYREVEETLKACEGDLAAAAERLEVSLRGLKQRMTELGFKKP